MAKQFLALVPIMGGSSYATDAFVEPAIQRAFDFLVSDWGSSFDIFDKPFMVNVWEIDEGASWYMDHTGLHVDGSDEPLDVLGVYSVHVPQLLTPGKRDAHRGLAYKNRVRQAVVAGVEQGHVDPWTGEPKAA